MSPWYGLQVPCNYNKVEVQKVILCLLRYKTIARVVKLYSIAIIKVIWEVICTSFVKDQVVFDGGFDFDIT